jgi:hypothetical protein
VLRPGGRLVVVDFMWRSADRAIVAQDARTELVRRTWGWRDFFAVDEYVDAAGAAGLAVRRRLDWSGAVTRPLHRQFRALARLGGSTLGRRLLVGAEPRLAAFTRAEWRELARVAEAHRFVGEHSQYGVLVLAKDAR